MPLDGYANVGAIRRDVAEIMRPPRRISVSQAAHDVVRIETPGGYSGPWDPDLTPYMVEPMDLLKSRKYRAVVVVAPARSGKTQALLDGWLAHCVTADPGDIGMYFSTQGLAHDYRKRRIERLHRNSPQMKERLSPRAHDTTIELIVYRSGMMLNLGWPTSSQVAQRDLRYVALTDYDSFPDDINGEGAPFDLAATRIQLAMSSGMALVESSPKRPITEANWIGRTAHEAPPTAGGILPIYNRGDRRRWYWACIDGCGERFEAPALPTFDDIPDKAAAGRSAHIACPHCGQVYGPARKRAMNGSGKWVPDATDKDAAGRPAGDPVESDIASFWLLGCAASFRSWESLVVKHLTAFRHAEKFGDETTLAATVNTDQGLPYRPRALDRVRGGEYLAGRARNQTERFYVPPGVRGLLSSVDIQGDRFEVAVWGHGCDNERWLVDRFSLRKMPDSEPIRPAAFIEHWNILVTRAIDATYRLDDGRNMRVHACIIDSGGQEGVTDRAYAWWRRLRKIGKAHRVFLAKGDGQSKGAPLTKRSYPDATKRRDRPEGGRGDVPILLINTQKAKDSVYNDLQRDVPGPGYIHFPEWTPQNIFDELAAEQRTESGWVAIAGRRNETWDLLTYDRALWHHLGGDGIDWRRPPSWLREWNENSEVLQPGQKIEPPRRLSADDFRVM